MQNGHRSVRLSVGACGLLSLAALGGSLTMQAQQAVPVAASASSYGDLLQFQPAANQPYGIGRGDVVSVIVEGRPELTAKQAVGPDGAIAMPLIGSVLLADQTRDQAAEAIRKALLPFYTAPVVTVAVEAYNSNRVLLLGAVERPGMLTFDHQPTLLEVLARGGSVLRSRPSGGGIGGDVNRGGGSAGNGETLPDRCIIYRGAQTAITLDVKQLVATGSTLANLRLQRDDTVFVPSPKDAFVSVLGQVQRPGTQLLDASSTLARIVADSGGLTQQAGKNPHIQIFDPATGRKREVEFKALLSSASSDQRLQAGDIIFIPTSGFNSFGYTLEKLSPLVSIFTTAALLNNSH